jgi:hypothetical protein
LHLPTFLQPITSITFQPMQKTWKEFLPKFGQAKIATKIEREEQD